MRNENEMMAGASSFDGSDERERLIRERAYAIWEAAGRPEGEQEAHWEQASREIDGGTLNGQQDLAGRTASDDIPLTSDPARMSGGAETGSSRQRLQG